MLLKYLKIPIILVEGALILRDLRGQRFGKIIKDSLIGLNKLDQLFIIFWLIYRRFLLVQHYRVITIIIIRSVRLFVLSLIHKLIWILRIYKSEVKLVMLSVQLQGHTISIITQHQVSLIFQTIEIIIRTNSIYIKCHLRVTYKILNNKFHTMWIFNWFKSTLESLGLMNKNAKIVFLGLDDAGKTTLLLRLKQDVMKQMDPTQQPYSQQLVMGKIRFKAWDLGGHEAARKTWRNYVSDVDGIIYLVDSSNVKRFEQSRIQLQGVMQMPQLQKVPIVILGNKIDKAGAVPQNQLRQALGIQGKQQWNPKGTGRPLQVFMCSVAKKSGYTQAFKWLSNYLK